MAVQGQEQAFYVLLCTCVVIATLFAVCSLLAVEFRRWTVFMSQQRQYFYNLALVELNKRNTENMRKERNAKLLEADGFGGGFGGGKGKSMAVFKLLSGMVLKDDAVDAHGSVLFKAGTKLDTDKIESLKEAGLVMVRIQTL